MKSFTELIWNNNNNIETSLSVLYNYYIYGSINFLEQKNCNALLKEEQLMIHYLKRSIKNPWFTHYRNTTTLNTLIQANQWGNMEFSPLIVAQKLWCHFLSNFWVTPVWTCKLFVCSLDPHVLGKPDRLKRRCYWCLHLSDFHMKRHTLFTCPVSQLFCPIGMLAAVNGVTLCLFQVCLREANWGVCMWEGNQTCCFSCRSIYHLLKCHMKLRQGKVSGVCMWYGRDWHTLQESISIAISVNQPTGINCVRMHPWIIPELFETVLASIWHW